MGSKYRLLPQLRDVFERLEFDTVLDAFTGSGAVAFLLKAMGKEVHTNDFLNFAYELSKAVIENASDQLSESDVASLLAPKGDDRDFVARTFRGRYFPDSDLSFLDSTWSHIEALPEYKRALAIASLCLAAARKQPRGVFTVTDLRYDDGRRGLRLPLREHFVETAAAYNSVVFDNGRKNRALLGDVFAVPDAGYDLVYLDPPYAPPSDDNCYIKRYHFLEGLSLYWRNQKILYDTNTLKLEKRFTPFSYKRTIRGALERLFEKFEESTIVLSYSTNSVPSASEIRNLLGRFKSRVEVFRLPHRYSFGTHRRAHRRTADELLFVGK